MLNTLILDGAIIFLFLIFFVVGARRGIIKSLFSLISLALSLAISMYVSSQVSGNIYNRFVRDNVIAQIKNSLDSQNITSNFFSKDILKGLPEFILNSLAYYGITEENLNHIINSGKHNIAEQVEKILSPVFIQAIKISIQVVLFFVLLIVFGFIIRAILSLFKFKIVKSIDTSVGAVLGLVTGYFVIMFLLFFLRIGLQITDSVPDIFSYDSIESTYIFRHMYMNNLNI